MIDEAFRPLRDIVRQMLAFPGELVDEEAGVKSWIYECEIESPVELDVVRDAGGSVQIGSTPPLYYVDTSIRPSFHRIRFRAEVTQSSDGE